jgi:hypothetical protein
MRGVQAAAAVLLALLVLASCGGEDEGFSDKKIADAIGVKDGAVGGDPFCVITDYLNDPDEIERADKRKEPAISSARGAVGVVVEPPFPDDCELKVRRALNKLDPKDEE